MKRWAPLFVALAVALTHGSVRAQPRSPAGGGDGTHGPGHATTIEMNLIVGDNKTIPAEDVTSYSLGAPGIVDVKVTPDLRSFVIVALRQGNTTVLLLKKNGQEVTYSINVYARSPEKVEQELDQLLAGYTGLRVRKVGTRFFIEGGVGTEADAHRVALIAGLYPGQVESLVVVGSVGIEHTINIRVDFYFVQYDKNSSYAVGVGWPGQIGPGSVSISHDFVTPATTATASIDQPLPSLDLAQTRGWAKVLKHSTVVTTSGSEATFQNGGEQNFQVTGVVAGEIKPIKFGANLTVLPRFDATTRDLEVKVAADVSDLTAPAGGSLPGRKTANVSTFVHLKLGQSIVLSGIRTSNETHSVTGLPLLSQIPILGVFFGGHTNSTDETEGAVFIIPSIVESVPRRAHDIVETALRQYEDFSGNIDKVSSYPKAPPDYR